MNPTSIDNPAGTVLVLGGTGSIGRLVVRRLLELGRQPRVLTRNPDRASSSLPVGAEVVDGDVTDAASLVTALSGVVAVVMTHGAPYGAGDAAAVDYGAVPALLDALAQRGDNQPVAEQVRVVMMTSIGVTGTGGSSRDLLTWKRRGERLLRASGLPYTIVRPGWFDAGTGTETRIDLRQGDATDYGPVRRTHVAETLVQALRTPAAISRTVEVFSTTGAPVTDWTTAFSATDADHPGALDGVHDPTRLALPDEPARVQADLQRLTRPTS